MASKNLCRAAGHPMRALSIRPVSRKSEAGASRDLLGGKRPKSVWPINPFRLNERLTLQKGLFLAPGDVRYSFVANLAALPGHREEANVMCFVLPRKEIHSLGEELYEANVTETTLFPGIDGFARSLSLSVRYLDLRFRLGFKDL